MGVARSLAFLYCLNVILCIHLTLWFQFSFRCQIYLRFPKPLQRLAAWMEMICGDFGLHGYPMNAVKKGIY